MHILFTPDGIPGWIGPQPMPGSVSVDLPEDIADPMMFLATHRMEAGAWVKREVRAPSAEELAAYETELAAQLRAAEDEAAARAAEAREMEIVRRAGPDQLLRAMGKITIAELSARVAAIRADVESKG